MEKATVTIELHGECNSLDINDNGPGGYNRTIRFYGSFKETMYMIGIQSGSGTRLAGEVSCAFIPKNVARKIRKEIRRRRKGLPKLPLSFQCDYKPLHDNYGCNRHLEREPGCCIGVVDMTGYDLRS